MNIMSIAIFVMFVVFVLVLSFALARRTRSASGYFAAGGQIHWSVNGVAFAGDYLSAASFLGICGMIAASGYDGFLYSVGYLAGWIVALLVVAEPMKRLGRYTFTDALDSRFNHSGIQLAAGISTLVVSICYLIPQMVGAGTLVTPLLGLPHAAGVLLVGAIVIIIVATAGMRSTTYVQFIKGGLLVIFSTVLVVAVCLRGLQTKPDHGSDPGFYDHRVISLAELGGAADPEHGFTPAGNYFKRTEGERQTWWRQSQGADGQAAMVELASIVQGADGAVWINGQPAQTAQQLQVGNLVKIRGQSDVSTGSIGPLEMLSALGDERTVVRRWGSKPVAELTDEGRKVLLFAPVLTTGDRVMRPGLRFKLEAEPNEKPSALMFKRLDFGSLMLALFLGTAALPHILIRYYTVPDPPSARKSTIVAIAVIGFFYILTLFMGLGAMVNGVINPPDDNMSAPLLAKSFNPLLFAVISAIAFATVLGTVSGLIVAASGAVAHDLLDRFCKLELNERQKVVIGKAAAFTVGLVAIILGIIFKGMNVTYLVGWAFAVAASANLPAIIMLLFWKGTTARGIVASILVGTVSAIAIILLSPEMFERYYGMSRSAAPIPLNQPAVFSVPLSFITLVVVSLMTRNKATATAA